MRPQAAVIQDLQFPLRIDQNGFRPVFKLGNEQGPCPFQCRFCGVGNSSKVSSEENIRLFDEKYAEYLEGINGPYHPAIYNRGNATNPKEFSRKTLNHILDAFEGDQLVKYISINSRESTATPELLRYLADKNLSYPVHFILGVESFSENATTILGKNTSGELERFIEKLKWYNREYDKSTSRKKYVFGLDVSLLFLPELYLKDWETREGNFFKLRRGIENDLENLLERTDPDVPIEINIHPFYSVEPLPYQDADLSVLIRCLPTLQEIVDQYNRIPGNYQTHLFVGVVILGTKMGDYVSECYTDEVQRLQAIIDQFNRTGKIMWK